MAITARRDRTDTRDLTRRDDDRASRAVGGTWPGVQSAAPLDRHRGG